MIKIITDSTSYIPASLIERYNISVVSLGILLENKSIKEVEIEHAAFYNELSNASTIPTSSQPSPYDMEQSFKTLLDEGHDIVGIFLSSKMSGTYNQALSVAATLKGDYPKAQIEIIDSTSNCMQLGFAVLAAAKAASEHKTIEEVVHATHEVIAHSRFLFTPDTLTYLKKGGRIGGASALVGTLLQIKPILTVENGKTEVFTKVRTKKKAIQSIINALSKDLETRDLGDIIVHHINALEDGEALAHTLSELLNREVMIQSIGPVIGTHVGPGSIGIAYYTIDTKK